MTYRKITPFRGRTSNMENIGARRLRKRRGSTLVEFAFVLPILLMLSMMLVQYGIILNTMIGLTNLSREGARYAAVNAATDATAKAAIQDHIEAKVPPGITLVDSDITVTCTPTACTPNSDVKISIRYNMKKKMFLPTKFLGINVFGSGFYTTVATMRTE